MAGPEGAGQRKRAGKGHVMGLRDSVHFPFTPRCGGQEITGLQAEGCS